MFGMEKSPFAVVVTAALEEARQRGDRRLGTEHLLLGLLRDPGQAPAQALGVDLERARAALEELDRAALRALGIDVGEVPPARPRKHPAVPGTALTSSARAAINQSIKATTRKVRNTAGPAQLLLALLAQGRPDPVAALIDHLGIDRTEVRDRLAA
ncbi:Clp protease N-terminal domain-containing protein [Nonomuraea guangzhouensis]|uniref:Clp protease N-terminal domain-containing protein n=1 Tax=Nonomuraea guangzhouensis TaxID=1291555 RepID=A0ABW4GI80_9ACTN|nr:Clp protease N-terminal domain-containing protein [Nonomuraea guangzhouensis]